MAGAAEGPGGAGVTVLRLWAATSQTPHLTVRPIHHLYELSHPEDARDGGRERRGEDERTKRGKKYRSKEGMEEHTETSEGKENNRREGRKLSINGRKTGRDKRSADKKG